MMHKPTFENSVELQSNFLSISDVSISEIILSIKPRKACCPFERLLTSLSMPRERNIKINPDRTMDHIISYASRHSETCRFRLDKRNILFAFHFVSPRFPESIDKTATNRILLFIQLTTW